MAPRFGLILLLLLGCSGTVDAFRKVRKANAKSVVQAMHARGEESVSTVTVAELQAATKLDSAKVSKIVTVSVGLLTGLISAFSEDPPDIEYAFENFQMQGWQLVKLFVPAEEHRSDGFRAAKKAWDKAFGDAPELIEKMEAAVRSGNTHDIIKAVIMGITSALETTAEAMPSHSTLFKAVADLVMEVGNTWLDFGKQVGWLTVGSEGSLMQVDVAGMDTKVISQLLTTGVGIVTSLVSAFQEDPPDFEYAFDSVQMSGWKMIKLIVPDPKSDGMKKAKNAWDNVFGDAAGLTEDIQRAHEDGTPEAIVGAVLSGLDTALRTCGEAFPEDKKYFDAVADLFKGMAHSLMGFSQEVGWV